MRACLHRGDLVLALGRNPRRDQVLGGDVSSEQERVVLSECVKRLLERSGVVRRAAGRGSRWGLGSSTRAVSLVIVGQPGRGRPGGIDEAGLVGLSCAGRDVVGVAFLRDDVGAVDVDGDRVVAVQCLDGVRRVGRDDRDITLGVDEGVDDL
jgi:hypothetical protein